MRNFTALRLAACVLTASCAMVWAGPGTAASSCLNNNLEKLCLDITSIPGDTVQPSGMGNTDTYVKYSAVFRNAGQNSTRHIMLTFQLSTAAGFETASFYADPNLNCTLSGSTISCGLDKFDAFKSYSVTAYALPPPYTGATTPATMTNTGTYGWNGNTQTTTSSVAISATSGKSYVPANKSVTLVTGPVTEDPSQQVTPENPLFAKVTVPARPQGYLAQVFVTQQGPDSSGDCAAGLFLNDGGPYVCRDPGMPTRWIQVDVPGDAFTAESPMDYVMFWDASIVPSTQQPPVDPVAPTGLPKFAIFYNQTELAVPYGRTRAFSNVCDSMTATAPCLYTVRQLGSGDYTAHFLKANDGSDMNGDPLLPLAQVLEFIIKSAKAGISLGPVTK